MFFQVQVPNLIIVFLLEKNFHELVFANILAVKSSEHDNFKIYLVPDVPC